MGLGRQCRDGTNFACCIFMWTAILQCRRPVLWLALAFAAGIVGASLVPVPALLLCIVAAILFIAAFLARCGDWKTDVLLLVLFAVLGALRYDSYTQLLPIHHIAKRPEVFVQGALRGSIAEEIVRDGEKTRFVLNLEEVETDSVRYTVCGQVWVTLRRGRLRADYGDRLELQGRLRRPSPSRNPGAFDYRAFLQRQNIHATLSVRDVAALRVIERLPGSWIGEHLVLPLRRSVRHSVEQNMSGAPAGLLLGLLLGEKRRVPDEVREQFRRAGLAHALVVSGMHVGLVAVFVFAAFRLGCRLPDVWSSAATIVVLVLYALVTELQPPVVRAVVVAVIVLCGRILQREGDIYNSLGLAALFILAIWPASLLGLSFQLSFAATFAIVGLHEPLARLFPARWRREDGYLGRWLITPFCASLAAQLGTGPLIALHFQQWSPIGLLANLAVAPLLAAAMGLGLLTALSGWVWPLLASVFNAANYLVLQGLLWLAEYCAYLPGTVLTVPRPNVLFFAFFAILCFLIAHMHEHIRARKMGIFLVLLWLNYAVWSRALDRRDLQVFFLDVGQGDAAFLRFPSGQTMVIDGGQRSPSFDNGARVLLPFLRYMNVERIDVVVASHPHSDHIGGLVALLETVEVGHYIDGGQIYDSWTSRRLRQLVKEKGIRYHRVAAGDSLVGLGGVGGLVLHPTRKFVDGEGHSPHGLNNGSVVLKLSYGKIDLLFTGDIEGETDAALLAWGGRLQAEVLKVAHHGSRTSSRPAFIEAVDAEWAIVSVGAFNKFRHPAPEVVQHFGKEDAEVLRTDRRGAVLLRSDGTQISVETMMDID